MLRTSGQMSIQIYFDASIQQIPRRFSFSTSCSMTNLRIGFQKCKTVRKLRLLRLSGANRNSFGSVVAVPVPRRDQRERGLVRMFCKTEPGAKTHDNLETPITFDDFANKPSSTITSPNSKDVAVPFPSALPPIRMVSLSALFYLFLVLAAALGGRLLHFPEELSLPHLLTPSLSHLPTALGATAFLVSNLLVFTGLADKVPVMGEMRMVLRGIMSQMSNVPLWGLGVIALGAGVGEEALFRGLLQTATTKALANADISLSVAEQAGLWSSSVVFGLAHAVTPFYTIWATCAGALFGWEYMSTGSLDAPILTHCLYDFIAFGYLANEFKQIKSEIRETDSSKN